MSSFFLLPRDEQAFQSCRKWPRDASVGAKQGSWNILVCHHELLSCCSFFLFFSFFLRLSFPTWCHFSESKTLTPGGWFDWSIFINNELKMMVCSLYVVNSYNLIWWDYFTLFKLQNLNNVWVKANFSDIPSVLLPECGVCPCNVVLLGNSSGYFSVNISCLNVNTGLCMRLNSETESDWA